MKSVREKLIFIIVPPLLNKQKQLTINNMKRKHNPASGSNRAALVFMRVLG